MNLSQDISFMPFQPQNQSEVKKLILTGLAEHWGTLDPSMNPDLDNIGVTYANAVFLVAWYNNKIIGTGALVPRSNYTAEIVRMSVASNMRRNGIGGRILQRLCAHAKSKGYQRLILETTDTWLDAIEFYKKFGFRITHIRHGRIYFALDISKLPGDMNKAG